MTYLQLLQLLQQLTPQQLNQDVRFWDTHRGYWRSITDDDLVVDDLLDDVIATHS